MLRDAQALRENMAKLSKDDLIKILDATLTGMDIETFEAEAKKIHNAKNPRWNRPYTELIYLPMQELMNYVRANGYKTSSESGRPT